MGLLDSIVEAHRPPAQDGNHRLVPDPGELAQRLREGEPAAVQEFCRLIRGGVGALLQRHLSLEQPQEEVQRVLSDILLALRRGELRHSHRLWEFVMTRVRLHITEWKSRHPAPEPLTGGRRYHAQVREMEKALRMLAGKEIEALRRFYVSNQAESEILAATGLSETEWRLLRTNCKTAFRRLLEGKPGVSVWAGQSRRRSALPRSA